jgi:alpha-beta hydrolase superfamily lysophospholipase
VRARVPWWVMAGTAGARLAENTPAAPIEAPLLIAQGLSDALVSAEVQAGYVAERCQAGQQLEYRTYPGLDHVPLVEADFSVIPDLVSWTQARLAGTPPPSTC